MKFRLGSVIVEIHPFFLLLAGLIGFIYSQGPGDIIPVALIVFFSVLFHECGHAFVATLFGYRANIKLYALGGVTERQGPRLKLWKEFFIVFAGPAFGFLLVFPFAVAFVLAGGTPDFSDLLPFQRYCFFGMMLNITWNLFNLAPIYPLDGYQLMRILFEGVLGVKGIRTALLISMALSGLLTITFFMSLLLLPGIIFSILTFEGWRNWNESRFLADEDQNQLLQHVFQEGLRFYQQGDLQRAKELFQAISKKVSKGVIASGAREILGEIAWREGRKEESYMLFSDIKNSLGIKGKEIFALLSYDQGEYKQAIQVGNALYIEEPSFETAQLLAKAHAQLGEKEAAIGWLHRAAEEGGEDFPSLFNQEPFISLER